MERPPIDTEELISPENINISPPIDYLNLLRNTPDIIKKTLLNLDYDEIINLCNGYERLSFICNDGYFWLNKIKRDFDLKEKDILNIPLNEARYRYLILLGIELDIKIENMKPKIPKYKDELKAEKSRLLNQKLRLSKLSRKQNNITILEGDIKNTEERISTLEKILSDYEKHRVIADRYFREAYEHINIHYEDKVININLSNDQEIALNYFLPIESFVKANTLEDYLIDNGLYDKYFNSGNIVLINDEKSVRIFIYIYEDRGILLAEYKKLGYIPQIGTHDLPKHLYWRYRGNLEEIIEKYNLPFNAI